jgi:hypothetical protein
LKHLMLTAKIDKDPDRAVSRPSHLATANGGEKFENKEEVVPAFEHFYRYRMTRGN